MATSPTAASGDEEPGSLLDRYSLNLVPSELFFKFRKEVEGLRVGVNLELGLGHNFQSNLTGWKWRISSFLGGDGVSQIRNKTSIGLFPGFDMRFGWRAEYVLPDIHGALGTGEPMIDMNYGRLTASFDRVEAIVTQ